MSTHIVFIEMSTTGAGERCLGYGLEQGYSVTLVAREPSAYAGLIKDGVAVVECDTNDLQNLLAEMRSLHQRDPVNGVTTTHDFYTPEVAAVAQDLGLPGLRPDAVGGVRNKYRMRVTLQRHASHLNPPFRLARSLGEARAAADELGFPLIAKPQDANDSWNVVRLDTDAQLADYMREAAIWSRNSSGQELARGVLLEGYIDGTEHAVDTVQHQGGKIGLLSVSGKEVTGEGGRYFAEVGDYLPLCGPDVELLFREASRALRLLGIDCGVIHTECRLKGEQVKILEVNPRLAGDMTGSHLIELALGASAVQQVVETALGNPVPWLPVRRRGAALIDVPMPRTGVFGGIVNLEEIRAQQGVELAHPLVKIGARRCFPPRYNGDLVGRVIATGATAEQALKLAKQAAAMARVTVLPEPGGSRPAER
jgi:biotin carboxylase